MRRSLLIMFAVAAISGWINRAELAADDPRPRVDWVRTADGWESRAVLAVDESPAFRAIHPGLVAAFQLTASLFVLVALPGRAAPVRAAASSDAGLVRAARRRAHRVLAESR